MADERVRLRRVLASGISLAIAAGIVRMFFPMRHVGWREALLVTVFAGPPAVAALLVWTERLGAQLLARACWWCYLAVGTLAVCFAGHRTGLEPVVGVAACALALLVAGRAGLDHGPGRFQPVAFRGTLTLSLVLAMADAASLSFFAVGYFCDEHFTQRTLALAVLAGLGWLGIAGLLRLRTWGLLTALATNLLVGVLALTRVLPVEVPIQKLFVATAALQLLVPLPMLTTIVLRRPPGPDRWRRFRSVGQAAVLLALVALAVYAESRATPLVSVVW